MLLREAQQAFLGEYWLQFPKQEFRECMRAIQGDIPQHTISLYMERFRFLYSRNGFYKAETKSRIPPIQTNCMAEVGNDMESVSSRFLSLGKKLVRKGMLCCPTEQNKVIVKYVLACFILKALYKLTSLNFVFFQLFRQFTHGCSISE